ncbi:methyltransferase domain-containing protein [uncultured Shewanella sp.]|uniref:methyltransferase domain-containing protein n=1 Tax=uncultured Shewanella sp. TaxID=173975 RepID=UPI0026078D8D|nr:methyltransferase domain-containing protein [uncultured Shewanella sp.]
MPSIEKDKKALIRQAYANAVKGKDQYVSGEQIMATNNKSVIELAGYTLEGLARVNEQVLEYNFSCGNPVDIANIRLGNRVLDLGCGTGLDLMLAAEKVGPFGHVIGIDITQEMLDIADKHIKASPFNNIELINAHIESIPCPTNSIDNVISNCVINLSSNKKQVMSETFRVLKPGGSIAFSDMVIDDTIPNWIINQAALYATCVSGATQLEHYLSIMQNVGFQDIEIIGFKTYSQEEMLSVLDIEATQVKQGVGEALFNHMLTGVKGKIHSVHITAKK